jgi:tetratricopeptide (TPR) repeat protein
VLHLLGAIELQRGRTAQAIRLIDQALALKPDHLNALNNRGVALGQSHRHAEALASFDQALAINPDSVEVLVNRGKALLELKRHGEAAAAIDQALALEPKNAGLLKYRGDALLALKRPAEAQTSYELALALKPDFAEAWFKRGNALRALQREQEAVESYDRTLALKPDHWSALNNRGNALRALQRDMEALESYDKALTLNPKDAMALYNRGNALRALNRNEEAAASYDRALSLNPQLSEAWNNRGNTLRALDRDSEALASYDRALALRPQNPETLNNRGNVLHGLGRPREALEAYDRALALKPDDAQIHLDASLCRLLLGDLERGWPEYEWRWRVPSFPDAKRKFTRPLWIGEEDISGKTILIYAEQGLGDTIQFCRYVPGLTRGGAEVLLHVQPALKPLLSGLLGVREVLTAGDHVPAYDLRCPLMSLPLAFGTTSTNIPARVPYLSPPRESLRKWESRLGKKHHARIGIAWSGSTLHKNNRNRSIELGKMLPLSIPGVQLHSLQKDVPAGDQELLQESNEILHFDSELNDFADTAALVSLMDVVISVDTAAAHLAGALGRPVWIMLPFAPDWRWLLHRDDSPWYPTAQLYRQPQIGDWDSVIKQLKESLAELALQDRHATNVQ